MGLLPVCAATAAIHVMTNAMTKVVTSILTLIPSRFRSDWVADGIISRCSMAVSRCRLVAVLCAIKCGTELLNEQIDLEPVQNFTDGIRYPIALHSSRFNDGETHGRHPGSVVVVLANRR